MTRKTGFTLIELLVVIAIIAILAAIIFPVFMRAKEAAYRSGDLSNMNALRTAVQLYRADQGAYPPALLGYASFYDPAMTQVIPASKLYAALYPKRVDSISTLRPAFDRNAETLITAAEWPNKDPRAVGSAPIRDLNGDGTITAGDDLAGARQAYASSPGSPQYFINDGTPTFLYMTTNVAQATPFYRVSGYDVAEVRLAPSGSRWELRYTLRWTSDGVNTGGATDDPRQLVYNDPPEDTVLSWNSWFRDYDPSGLPQREKKDYVLFLGGGARPWDSVDVNDRSWRVVP